MGFQVQDSRKEDNTFRSSTASKRIRNFLPNTYLLAFDFIKARDYMSI